MNARAFYICSSAESKRMSPARLVSLEVLNSFESQSLVLHKSPSTVTVLESKTVQEKLEKEGASFVHFLTRVTSNDRPMSARTRTLLGKLPQNHAGNHAVNGSGMRRVLMNEKDSRNACSGHDFSLDHSQKSRDPYSSGTSAASVAVSSSRESTSRSKLTTRSTMGCCKAASSTKPCPTLAWM